MARRRANVGPVIPAAPHRYDRSYFTNLGEMVVETTMHVGEELEHPVPGTAGTWTVFFIEEHDYDAALRELGSHTPDFDYKRYAQQLQLVRTGIDLDEVLTQLEYSTTTSIHSAWYRAGDADVAETLKTIDWLDERIDGVEGICFDGRAVSVYLGGDGAGRVWAAGDGDQITLVHIDLV